MISFIKPVFKNFNLLDEGVLVVLACIDPSDGLFLDYNLVLDNINILADLLVLLFLGLDLPFVSLSGADSIGVHVVRVGLHEHIIVHISLGGY